MMSPIRVIIYGVGEINQIAARLIRERGVEVVGAINRTGPKVGRDLGEVAGLDEKIGVIVSDDAETVLATPADLALVGIYSDMERMFPIFQQCLEHDLNVISVGEHHSYPGRLWPEQTRKLDELAKSHGVTITGSGNQDFFMVNLGTLMTGVCQRIERITHRSLTDVNNFGPEVAEVTYVDQTPEQFASQSNTYAPSIYTTFWDNVASDLDLEVLDITQQLEPMIAERPHHCRALDRTIDTGRILGIRQRLEVTTAEGLPMNGENVIQVCAPEAEEFKEWEIYGEPSFKVRATDIDTGLTTTTQYVNRIPHVIEAPPGYVTLEKLPKLTFRAKLEVDR